MGLKNYNYFDEGEANINFDEFEDLNDFISRSRQAEDLGFFPTSVAQKPAMVNYGIGTLPQFDMANLPMYEKDDEETEQYEIDKFGYRKKPSGIAKLLDYLPFVGEKSLGRTIIDMLPKMSPEASNIRNFYGSQFGLTPTGQVASGIMKGYNPVSGSNLLNRFTGGLIPERQIGLAPAMRRRIDRIANRKIDQTDASRAKIAELQNLARADTISRARQANPSVYEGRRGGFDTSAADRAGTSAGSGQGFSNKSGRGRTGY